MISNNQVSNHAVLLPEVLLSTIITTIANNYNKTLRQCSPDEGLDCSCMDKNVLLSEYFLVVSAIFIL